MYRDNLTPKINNSPTSFSKLIQTRCTQCNTCTGECAFLEKYGNPWQIVNRWLSNRKRWQPISFECSLCGLCDSLCPENLPLTSMFLEARQQSQSRGKRYKQHRKIRNYEKKGTSNKYSLYSLPKECDTIFFPGCSLPGTSPEITKKALEYLKKSIPNLGIVLDCCTKPSHDLGRQEYFTEMFAEMKTYLLHHGIRKVILACPSCYTIFSTYANNFEVQTIYELMVENGFQLTSRLAGSITIHDPCTMRLENKIQESVRTLITTTGLELVEPPHSKESAYCCGEGGAVSCVTPQFAKRWTEKRLKESSGQQICSYCAGCVNFFSNSQRSFHILDLLFAPEKTLTGTLKISKAPFTYLNRLQLKRSLKKIKAKVTRERCFQPKSPTL